MSDDRLEPRLIGGEGSPPAPRERRLGDTPHSGFLVETQSMPVAAFASFDVELDPERLKTAISLVAKAVEAEDRRRVGQLIVRLFGAGLGFTSGMLLGGFFGAVFMSVVGLCVTAFAWWPISTTLGALTRARLVRAAGDEGLDADDLVDAVLLCRKGQIVGYEDAINEAHQRRRRRRLRR
jgi:hypothetical protein